MQLRSARLCLDCEELHEDPQCPVCTSEAFVYITRWIPVDARRTRKRAVPRPSSGPRVSHVVGGGAVGLAVLAAARWLLHSPTETTSPVPRSGKPSREGAGDPDASAEPGDSDRLGDSGDGGDGRE